MASFSSSPSSPWADLVLGLERASAPTSPDAASALLSALAAVDARAIDDDNVVEAFLAGLAHALHAVCLLYTSPSPRDRTRSRMPSSA